MHFWSDLRCRRCVRDVWLSGLDVFVRGDVVRLLSLMRLDVVRLVDRFMFVRVVRFVGLVRFSGVSSGVVAVIIGRGRFHRLDESRSQDRRSGLGWLGRFAPFGGCLLGLGRFGKQRAGGQFDLPCTCVPLHELARHDLFDGTGRALDLDARFLLEQRDGVRA
jgi:hypothetical protein